MRAIVVVFAALVCAACASRPTGPGPEVAAEFGICYDARACPAGSESAFSVERNACSASGGKSWKGGASGCVNL